MSSLQRTTASQRQGICKKLITILKKKYKKSPPKSSRPVLETVLFAICLENTSFDDAEAAFAAMEARFHDLNEIRVSSITELEAAFQGLDDPEWRALRVRNTLQYVFEKYFVFEFEGLRRKTLEQATKQLKSIDTLTPFVRSYVLQVILGSHLVPLDDAMRNAAVWLGLVVVDQDAEAAGESLKSSIRKADVPLFCHLLRCLATDSNVSGAFAGVNATAAKQAFDASTAPERLSELLKKGFQKPKRIKAKRASTNSKKTANAAKSGTRKTPRKASSTKKTDNHRKLAARIAGKKAGRKTSRTASRKKTSAGASR